MPHLIVSLFCNIPDWQFRVIDFHAEATGEKRAFGYYLDGRVSGVYGTHTHVPTADETVLPNGTGYICLLYTSLLLCGILAAVMSTADSQLLVTSSSVSEDLYRGVINRKASDKNALLVLSLIHIWRPI